MRERLAQAYPDEKPGWLGNDVPPEKRVRIW